MNLGGDSVNVYAEAKSEYTRQLCQILSPSFQLYFLDVLKAAKDKDTDARRMLWNFQAMLQEIPDWSQDKVLRETEKIIRESNCDYLEELLTAVFIAHTKVLSAIRITTKQKKLQLTIPKLDHFLHRTLREIGRLLWGNAFLFAEQGSPIDRQKNMRQVEGLIQEGIQQAIRSLLPVKTILREYLNDEGEDDDTDDKKKDEEEDEEEEEEEEKPKKQKEAEAEKEEVVEEEKPAAEAEVEPPAPVEAPAPPANTVVLQAPSPKAVLTITKEDTSPHAPLPSPFPLPSPPPESEAEADAASAPATVPHFIVATEPSVSFTNMDTIFDSDNPEKNEIVESPAYSEEIEAIETLDLPPEPMDNFEELA